MLQRPHLALLSIAGLVAIQACSGETLFSEGDPTVVGPSSSGSTSSNASSSSGNGGATTASSSGSGAGGAGASGGTSTVSSSGAGGDNTTTVTSSSMVSTGVGGGGTGGMGGSCDHDPCVQGPSLAPNCDPCVAQICQGDPFCCSAMGNWDELCQAQVWSVCNLDCNPGLVLCDTQYDTMQGGYYLCVQGIDVCSFGHNLQQNGSCGQFCAAQGGECVDAVNNQGQCGYDFQVGCASTQLQTGICICSRGCGGGPACPTGQTCNNGTCQ